MAESMPWSKMWWGWYASRSHAELGGVALALGAPMMLLCRASAPRHRPRHGDAHGDGHRDVPRDVTEWDPTDAVCARTKNGKPVSIASIARTMRFSTSEVEAAMGELIDAGTAYVSADGAYGLLHFWTYQEAESAARTRDWRASHRDDKGDRHRDGESDGHGDAHGDGQKTEVRREREEEKGQRSEPQIAGAREAVVSGARALEASLSTEPFGARAVAKIFSDLRKLRKRGSFTPKSPQDWERAEKSAADAREAMPADPAQWCRVGIENFLTHGTGHAAVKWDFWGWANDPDGWFNFTPTQPSAAKQGPAKPAARADYAKSGGWG